MTSTPRYRSKLLPRRRHARMDGGIGRHQGYDGGAGYASLRRGELLLESSRRVGPQCQGRSASFPPSDRGSRELASTFSTACGCRGKGSCYFCVGVVVDDDDDDDVMIMMILGVTGEEGKK